MGLQQSSNTSKKQFSDLFQSQVQQVLIEKLDIILQTKCSQKQFFESHFPSDVRHLIHEKPDDAKVIIMFLYNTLNLLVRAELQDGTITKLTNILRFITQFMPVLFEASNRDFILELLWKQKVLESITEDHVSDIDPPLLISIIRLILKLLFKKKLSVEGIAPNETITKQDSNLQSFIQMFQNTNKYTLNTTLLWKGFITMCSYPNDQIKFYEFRVEALQALQACLSGSLFVPPYILCKEGNQSTKITSPNPALLSIYSLPHYPELLVSLISVVFYAEDKNMVFIKQILNKSSLEYTLHKTSTKILLTLLCGQIGVKYIPELFQNIKFPDLCVTTDYFRANNSVFPLVPQIPKSFVISLFTQISSQLWEVYEWENRVVGALDTKFDMHAEFLLIMTFFLLQIESEVLPLIKPQLMIIYLLSSLSSSYVISSLAFYGMSLLSSIPSILNQLDGQVCIRLQNKDFPIVQGKWTDLMIQGWCERVLNGHKNINVHQVVSIMKNVSPSIKSLQHQSAYRICQMLVMFSNYDFLLAHPENAKSMFKLISVIYTILQQNIELNEFLLYEIMQREIVLQRIQQMQISDAKILFFCQKFLEPTLQGNVSTPIRQNRQNNIMIDHSEADLRNTLSHLPPQKDITIQEEQESLNHNIDIDVPQEEQKTPQEDQQILNEEIKFEPIIKSKYQVPKYNIIQKTQTDNLRGLWAGFDMNQAKQDCPLDKLIKFINTVKQLLMEKKVMHIELQHVKELITQRNLTCMFEMNAKQSIEQFDSGIGYQLVNRLSWQTLFEKSLMFPPFYERSECVYLDYAWV